MYENQEKIIEQITQQKANIYRHGSTWGGRTAAAGGTWEGTPKNRNQMAIEKRNITMEL